MLTDIQTSIVRKLENLVKGDTNLDDKDKLLLKLYTLQTVASWADKQVKQAKAECNSQMDQKAVDDANKWVKKHKVKRSAYAMSGVVYDLHIEIRSPGSRLDKSTLRDVLINTYGLSGLQADDAMKRATLESEPASVYVVSDADALGDDD